MSKLDRETVLRLTREASSRYQGPSTGNLLEYLQTATPFAKAVALKSKLVAAFDAQVAAHVAMSLALCDTGVETGWRGY